MPHSFLENIDEKIDILNKELKRCDTAIDIANAEGRTDDTEKLSQIRDGLKQISNTLLRLCKLKEVIRKI